MSASKWDVVVGVVCVVIWMYVFYLLASNQLFN